MGSKHHTIHEIFRILEEGQTGKESKRTVCGKHGITEQTFYRWQKLYPKAIEARRLKAQGRGLQYLRMIGGMEIENGRRVDPGDPPDDPPPLPSDDTNTYEDALSSLVSPEQPPSVAYATAPRQDRLRVRMHGRLPRGEFELLQISLPKDLHQRLRRQGDASLNQSIAGLVRYALDMLDQGDATLHLYDPSRAAPTLPTRSPVRRVGDLLRKRD